MSLSVKEIYKGCLGSPKPKDLYIVIMKGYLPEANRRQKMLITEYSTLLLLMAFFSTSYQMMSINVTFDYTEGCINMVLNIYHASLFVSHIGTAVTCNTIRKHVYSPHLYSYV